MSDSFFTSRNRYDPQARNWDRHVCTEVLEAATRRAVELEGFTTVAKAHYRIADICAAANLVPLDRWGKAMALEAAEKAVEEALQQAVAQKKAAPARTSLAAVNGFLGRNAVYVFLAGFLAGLWMGMR